MWTIQSDLFYILRWKKVVRYIDILRRTTRAGKKCKIHHHIIESDTIILWLLSIMPKNQVKQQLIIWWHNTKLLFMKISTKSKRGLVVESCTPCKIEHLINILAYDLKVLSIRFEHAHLRLMVVGSRENHVLNSEWPWDLSNQNLLFKSKYVRNN